MPRQGKGISPTLSFCLTLFIIFCVRSWELWSILLLMLMPRWMWCVPLFEPVLWVGSLEKTLSLLEDSKVDDGESALLLLLLLSSGNESGKTEGVLVRLLSLLDGEDVIWTSCSFFGSGIAWRMFNCGEEIAQIETSSITEATSSNLEGLTLKATWL